jgi:hypothetical protein
VVATGASDRAPDLVARAQYEWKVDGLAVEGRPTAMSVSSLAGTASSTEPVALKRPPMCWLQQLGQPAS